MIDIHSHILPTIDDGPDSMIKALEMARLAEEDGIKIIIATPHVISGEYDLTKQSITEAVNYFNQELQKQAIGLTVLPGAENYLDLVISDKLKLKELMTLNDGGKFLLIELPMHSFPNYTEKVLFDLRLAGITPIIAHPERNLVINENPDLLYNLISKGALSQINANSIMGAFGRQVAASAKLFLEQNWVHFLATDCHSCGTRGPRLKDATSVVSKMVGEEKAQELVVVNPQKVIAGEEITSKDFREYTPDQGMWKKLKTKLFS